MIAGESTDANGVSHGFLRKPDGRFIVFDAPRAGTGPNQGTAALDINLEGEIAGYTLDNNNVSHGTRTALFRNSMLREPALSPDRYTAPFLRA